VAGRISARKARLTAYFLQSERKPGIVGISRGPSQTACRDSWVPHLVANEPGQHPDRTRLMALEVERNSR
jgi:hypothetical protein